MIIRFVLDYVVIIKWNQKQISYCHFGQIMSEREFIVSHSDFEPN